MANKFPPGGALFGINKKSDNGPSKNGSLEISSDLLDYLNRVAREGKPIKMELAAWDKTDRNGKAFLSLSASIPWTERQGTVQPQPVARKTVRVMEDDEIPF